MMLDTDDQDRLPKKNASLYHIIKSRKRKHKRTIRQIRDEHGTTHTTTITIMRTLTAHFSTKYQLIQIDDESLRQLLKRDLKETTNVMNTTTTLEEPINTNELWSAITKGKPHKAPGHDGIGIEFYKGEWEIIKTEFLKIINNMYKDETILENQLKD